MENRKRIITMVGIVLILLVVIGATFAYFIVQGNSGANKAVNVTTATTDSLMFEIGKSLSIEADQKTFASGTGNQADTTTATATLKANNKTNSAVGFYNMYLEIADNSFKYTTEEKTAELILTIIKPDKTPLTTVPGLTPVTVGGVSGFDITTKKGVINILEEYEIVSTGTKTDEWEVTITLVNLDKDQSKNAGNGLTATLTMQKANEINVTSLADVCSSGDNFADCIKEYSETYDFEESKIMHHTTSLANSAKDNSYRYAGANTYKLNLNKLPGNWVYEELELMGQKGTVVYNQNDTGIDKVQSVIAKVKNGTFSPEDLDGMLFQEYPEGSGIYLFVGNTGSIGDEIYQLYIWASLNVDPTIFGVISDLNLENHMFYYLDDERMNEYAELQNKINSGESLTDEETEKMTSLALEVLYGSSEIFFNSQTAMDDAYKKGLLSESRVSHNINNYVCFGSNEAKCPNENLYQIIGVFNNQVKLIKSISMKNSELVWTHDWQNNANWENAVINNYLNTTYLNSLGNWSNKIATTTWSVGGATYDENKSAKSYYDEEMNNSVTYNAKIGLPYIHEYGFATDSGNWNSRITGENNWLNSFLNWTISFDNNPNRQEGIVIVINDGLDITGVYAPDGIPGTKPTFYLNNDVTYIKGNGTRSNPYRIA